MTEKGITGSSLMVGNGYSVVTGKSFVGLSENGRSDVGAEAGQGL